MREEGHRLFREHNTIRSCSPQSEKRKEYKEHDERKPRVSEAAILTFPAQEDSIWLPRGADNWTVGTDTSEGSFFTVAKNFGGGIRVIHCLHTPRRSGDTVAVQTMV